jgi:DNA repair photolyase
MTRSIFAMFADANLRATVLTKGGTRAVRDFEIFAASEGRLRFGTSLVWSSDDMREKYEPCAASIERRLRAVEIARLHSIRTWASIEPVIDCYHALTAMQMLIDAGCQEFKIGKINHNKALANRQDWRAFVAAAKDLCERSGVAYKFKDSLLPYCRETLL